jgi:hypothetical protein
VRSSLAGLGTFTLKDPSGFELSYTPSGKPSTDALGETSPTCCWRSARRPRRRTAA